MRALDARETVAVVLLAVSVALLWFAFSPEEGEPVQSATPARPAYQSRDWNEEHQGRLNISLYTFRDRNRNGRHDVGDLPMASVAVRLDRPEEPDLEHVSNINGFANFKMSYQREDADISRAGRDYGFEVQIPPGWAVTTDNAAQVIRFIQLAGSVTGLVARTPPAAVGLAPELTVSGRLEPPGDGGHQMSVEDFRLLAIDFRGRQFAKGVDESGKFAFTVEPGNWQILAEYVPTGELLQRALVVSDAPVRLATLAFGRQRPLALTSTITQDFEYLTRSGIDKIPGGSAGLDWDYLIAADNQLYNSPGFVNALRSGKNVGYNSSGHPVTITPAPGARYFDFVGAWFAAAWPESEGETLVLEAWRKGESVAREELALSFLGPVWFAADFRQIDRLTLTTAHYWQFITEDMVFRVRRPVGTPLGEDQALRESVQPAAEQSR